MATKQAVASETATTDPDADSTVLDTQSAAVKRLIAKGKERGYITFDELNAVLPPDQMSSEQIEESLGRTDDPVRMYLREMGTVELLSREGEIAIAKRIEAGRDMMIGGLCESPLTFRAIIAWHDALKAGRMLLRDIVDLEATQGGPPAAEVTGEPRAPSRRRSTPPPRKARTAKTERAAASRSPPLRKS
jgi:RNA polymerase primary sigma factor